MQEKLVTFAEHMVESHIKKRFFYFFVILKILFTFALSLASLVKFNVYQRNYYRTS